MKRDETRVEEYMRKKKGSVAEPLTEEEQKAIARAAFVIRQARLAQGWSPEVLAEKSRVSNKTIREIEKEIDAPSRRKRFPCMQTIARLCIVLQMDAVSLFSSLYPSISDGTATRILEEEQRQLMAKGPNAKYVKGQPSLSALLVEAGLSEEDQLVMLSNPLLREFAREELKSIFLRITARIAQIKTILQTPDKTS